jgi:hypothetical protein
MKKARAMLLRGLVGCPPYVTNSCEAKADNDEIMDSGVLAAIDVDRAR